MEKKNGVEEEAWVDNGERDQKGNAAILLMQLQLLLRAYRPFFPNSFFINRSEESNDIIWLNHVKLILKIDIQDTIYRFN